MGNCKSRCPNRKAKECDVPAKSKNLAAPVHIPVSKKANVFRADAEEYVPVATPTKTNTETEVNCKTTEEDVPKTQLQPWEQFLRHKEGDIKNGTKFLRCADGTFTSEYQKLLKKAPPGQDTRGNRRQGGQPASPPATSQDALMTDWKNNWRASADTSNTTRSVEKSRKPTALKRTILAARDAQQSELWALQKKFEEKTRRLDKLQVPDDSKAVVEQIELLESTKRSVDDVQTKFYTPPFGFSDAHYCSDSEDTCKSHYHRTAISPAAREYVTHPLSPVIDDALSQLMFRLRKLKDSEKFMTKAPKRYTFGIREVFRALSQNRIAILIVAPDLEAVNSAGGLDEKISNILEQAKKNNVPIVFGLSRRRLGMALQKSLSVSVFAIENARGAEEELTKLKRLANR